MGDGLRMRGAMNGAGTTVCLTAIFALAGCAARAPLVISTSVGPEPPYQSPRTGELVVYSATYTPTVEQSEYPMHTDYTIATKDGKVIERVVNGIGPFRAYPAKVTLSSGEYHVRAQYDRGGFVIVPVVIEAGKTTIVDLNGEAPPQGTDAPKDMVRLPNGHVVGWRATSG
jgi:hypothetical protein